MNSITKLSIMAAAANAAPQFVPNFPLGNGFPFGQGFPFNNVPGNNGGGAGTTPSNPAPTCAGLPFVIPAQTLQGFTFAPYVTIPSFTIPARTLTLSGICDSSVTLPLPTTTTTTTTTTGLAIPITTTTIGLPIPITTTTLSLPLQITTTLPVTLPITTTLPVTLPITTTLPVTLPITTTLPADLPTETLIAIGAEGTEVAFNLLQDVAIDGTLLDSIALVPDTGLALGKRQEDQSAAAQQACANLCAEDDRCDAFQSFLNDLNEQQCELKAALGALTTLIGSVVGFKGDDILPALPTTVTTTTTAALPLATDDLPTDGLTTDTLPLSTDDLPALPTGGLGGLLGL
ncbi:hypothetical protein CERZMDRAFT_99423 [Cercospora zeae-maydis SCOH1-5]|uniref:Uncharacterized protein n=1 Tax=Cercospora zeae-maydis SCOH1-5 TaxID=717836 RepID=A0A6A6FAC8_9PEZI|nr:hypothetical protein CERZMDRAFT_99423 [Cercospora zeae-maydis SCOH1-5]